MAIPLSFKEFLDRAREVHGDKFEYIESTFKGSLARMTIVCKDHGEFLMTPASHTHSRQQCKLCYQDEVVASNRLKYSQRLREKCDNSVVISDWGNFRRLADTITLDCSLHGEYSEKLLNVLCTAYNGCLSCKVLKEGESFVKKAMKIHKGGVSI